MLFSWVNGVLFSTRDLQAEISTYLRGTLSAIPRRRFTSYCRAVPVIIQANSWVFLSRLDAEEEYTLPGRDNCEAASCRIVARELGYKIVE